MYANPSRITDDLCDATVRCDIAYVLSQQPGTSYSNTINFNPTMDK